MQHLEDERIGESLVRLHHCTEKQVCEALGRQFGLPTFVSLAEKDVDDELVEQVPIGFARANVCLPWKFDRDMDEIHVVTADPLRLFALDDLGQIFDAEVQVTLMSRSAVIELINKTYSKRAKDVDLEKKEEAGLDDEDILHASAEDAPIIRFVNSLIFNASKEKASDIHIEPGDKEVIVRFRVDGVLQEIKRAAGAPLKHRGAREDHGGPQHRGKRLPQDGRIRRKIAGKEVDTRVATAPRPRGASPSACSTSRRSCSTCGASAWPRTTCASCLRPSRVPTASSWSPVPPVGKTTTLYSALSEINKPELNILTVEDPWSSAPGDQPGAGAVQDQPHPPPGCGPSCVTTPTSSWSVRFVTSRPPRSPSRPRSPATSCCPPSATNDASTGITRLVDLGVQPFLVASSLCALQAQRLIRRVCPHCCEAVSPTEQVLRELNIDPAKFMAGQGAAALRVPVRDEHGNTEALTPQGKCKIPPKGKVWEARGCEHCHGIGYSGRTGIYEVLPISEPVRRMTIQRASGAEIKETALAEAATLRDDGAHKLLSGMTTVDEACA